jgi:hypothetical protein
LQRDEDGDARDLLARLERERDRDVQQLGPPVVICVLLAQPHARWPHPVAKDRVERWRRRKCELLRRARALREHEHFVRKVHLGLFATDSLSHPESCAAHAQRQQQRVAR